MKTKITIALLSLLWIIIAISTVSGQSNKETPSDTLKTTNWINIRCESKCDTVI